MLPSVPLSDSTTAEGELQADRSGADFERVGLLVSGDQPLSRDNSPSVVGRVVDGMGRPVPEAHVTFAYEDEWHDGALDVDLDSHSDREWLRTERDVDASGHFHLGGLRRGKALLSVHADGFAPLVTQHVTLPSTGKLDLGDLALEPGLVLEGRVVDHLGAGVSGARLARKDEIPGFGLGPRARHAPVAVCDPDGSFRVACMAPGAWTLRVESDEHPIAWFDGADHGTGLSSGHIFRLARSWTIAGRLEVPGLNDYTSCWVRMSLVHGKGEFPELEYRQRVQRIECEADGSFECRQLFARDATSSYTLRAGRTSGRLGSHVGEELEVHVGQRDVLLVGEALAGLTFELHAGGLPLKESQEPKIYLVVGGNNHIDLDERGSVHGTGPGRFLVPDFVRASASASYALHIKLDGYRDYVRSELGMVPGEVQDLGVFELQAQSSLNVVVLDARTRAPIEHAKLVRSCRDAKYLLSLADKSRVLHFDPPTVTHLSDTTGRARIPLVKDKDNSLVVSHPDFATTVVEALMTTGAPSSDELLIALGQGATLRVNVADENGSPVADASIAGQSSQRAEAQGGLSSTTRDSSFRGKTDETGRLVFEHLPAGRTEVTLDVLIGEAPGELLDFLEGGEYEVDFIAPSKVDVQVIVLEAGVALVDAQIDLVLPGRADEEGDSGPAWSRRSILTAETSGTGRAYFNGVSVGAYDLVVSHATRTLPATHSIHVRLDSAPLTIDLDVAVVRGRILGAQGEACVDALVCVYPSELDSREMLEQISLRFQQKGLPESYGAGSVRSDDSGRFELRGLRPREELLVVGFASGYQLASSTAFSLEPDGVHSIADLRPERAGSLEVGFGDAEIKLNSLFDYKLRLTFLDEPQISLATRTGYFAGRRSLRFGHMPPGKWRMQLFKRGFGDPDLELPAHGKTLHIRPGEESHVDLAAPN